MQKVSITSDASLWAELAKRRHENFCSLFLRVAIVESTRIYEKLVAKKVKDTPLFFNGKWRKYAAAEIDTAVHILEIGYRRSIQYIVYIVLGPDATNK